MWLRCVAFMVLCLGLCGCVLQSAVPNFTEAEGVALPAALGTRFVAENLKDGLWRAEEGGINFEASGKHYVTHNEKSDQIYVLFVALGDKAWVMQAAEKDRPSAYMLVDARDDTLLLRPLLCDDLKKRDDVTVYVRFEGSDCFLKGSAGLDVFRMLGVKMGDAKMRLRAVK